MPSNSREAVLHVAAAMQEVLRNKPCHFDAVELVEALRVVADQMEQTYMRGVPASVPHDR